MLGYLTATFCNNITIIVKHHHFRKKTYCKVLLCLILVLVPTNDGWIGPLHHSLGCLVSPGSAEHKDLTGLLHVLLVHGGLLLGEHIGWERLRGGHAWLGDGRGAKAHPPTT